MYAVAAWAQGVFYIKQVITYGNKYDENLKKLNPYYNPFYVTYRGKGSREDTGAFCWLLSDSRSTQKTGSCLRGLPYTILPYVGKRTIKEVEKRYI